jgi:hypothetical protein
VSIDAEQALLIMLAQEVRARAPHYISESTGKAADLTIQDLRHLAAGGCPLQGWQVRRLAQIMGIDAEQVA